MLNERGIRSETGWGMPLKVKKRMSLVQLHIL